MAPLDRARGPVRRSSPPTLTDTFGRAHTYLRISLTERCSLRCTYCMPPSGVALTRSEELLTSGETVRLATLFVTSGVTKIRLTGGEPTLRPDLPELVGSLSALRPLGLESLCMTSNGVSLSRSLGSLKAAGLDRLNLSLDTLRRERFIELTRRDALPKVHRETMEHFPPLQPPFSPSVASTLVFSHMTHIESSKGAPNDGDCDRVGVYAPQDELCPHEVPISPTCHAPFSPYFRSSFDFLSST